MEPRRLRTLVVEDEWAARNYLVEMLHASGQAVVVAAVATLPEADRRELVRLLGDLGASISRASATREAGRQAPEPAVPEAASAPRKEAAS